MNTQRPAEPVPQVGDREVLELLARHLVAQVVWLDGYDLGYLAGRLTAWRQARPLIEEATATRQEILAELAAEHVEQQRREAARWRAWRNSPTLAELEARRAEAAARVPARTPQEIRQTAAASWALPVGSPA